MCIRSWLGWPLRASGRPLQRSVTLLVAWTFLCYALFQISGSKSGAGDGSMDYAGAGPVNSRLLLQKVTESPATSTVALNVANTPSASTDASAAKSPERQKSPTNEEQLAPFIQERVPNVPFEFWLREKNRIYGKNHTCAFYPSVFDIKYNNK